MKNQTKAQLARKVQELEGQLSSRYSATHRDLHKAGSDHLMGSGCLIQLTALGGRELVGAVIIKDGLSKATIDSIKADIKRSQALSGIFDIKE